jgi:tetratricopeptide (TPR) repeat protein
MIVLRGLATLLVVAIAAVLIYRDVYVPLVCNYETSLLAPVSATEEIADNYVRTLRSRDQLARARTLLERCPANVNAAMAAAGNANVLGRHEETLAICRDAYRYHRRAELVLGMGIAFCGQGDQEKAIERITRACLFDPKLLLYSVPPECKFPEIEQTVFEHQLMIVHAKLPESHPARRVPPGSRQ